MKTFLGVAALALTTSLTATLTATVGVAAAAHGEPTAQSSPAQASPARQAPVRTVLDVRDLDQGAAPQIPWTERRAGGTVLHGILEDVPVPNRITELVQLGSRFVIQTAGSGKATTRLLDSEGATLREWRTGHGLAVSTQVTAAAFTGRRGKVWTVDAGGSRVLRFPRVPISGTGRIGALTGDHCKEDETSNGCTIYVNAARAWLTSSHGIVDRVPTLRRVTTGSDRWLGGITSVSDFGSCSAMLRLTKVRWRTCDNQLSDISSNNAYVIGTPAYADGFGPTSLDILSVTNGSVVARFAGARSFQSATYFDQVWEDDSHVLVVTYQDGKWAVVRLGIDGSMEYAVAPRAGSMDARAPFGLRSS